MAVRAESYERLGTTAYAYLLLVDPTTSLRVSGHVLGDLTLSFRDPDGTDITGSTSFTLEEYDSGAYRLSVPLPSSGQGEYTLVCTDPYSRTLSVVFHCYLMLEGSTGDATARQELWYHKDGVAVEDLTIDDLTYYVYDGDMTDVTSSLTCTLTELEAGHYIFAYDVTALGAGAYLADVVQATYAPTGELCEWRYVLLPAQPTIVDVSATASEVTVQTVGGNGTVRGRLSDRFAHEQDEQDGSADTISLTPQHSGWHYVTVWDTVEGEPSEPSNPYLVFVPTADYGRNYSGELPLQEAVYAALSADTVLMSIISAVYDEVPGDDEPTFPYVTIGQDTAVPFDTKTSTGEEITLSLHVWSRYRGRTEVKQIQGHLKRILHEQNLLVDDYKLVHMRREYSDSRVAADGVTRQGMMRFRAIVESAWSRVD